MFLNLLPSFVRFHNPFCQLLIEIKRMNVGRDFLYDIWKTTQESNWKSLESNLKQRRLQARGTEARLLEGLMDFTRSMYYSKERFPRYFESFIEMVRELG